MVLTYKWVAKARFPAFGMLGFVFLELLTPKWEMGGSCAKPALEAGCRERLVF